MLNYIPSAQTNTHHRHTDAVAPIRHNTPRSHGTHLNANLPVVIAQAEAGRTEEVEVVAPLEVAQGRGAAVRELSDLRRAPRAVVGDERHEPCVRGEGVGFAWLELARAIALALRG